jgi:hypothetical protein
MTRYSVPQRESAARRAARKLCHHGISHLGGHCLFDLDRSGASAVLWLADMAAHIDSLDPTEIGAAALLEADGFERTNVQLALGLTVSISTEPRRTVAVDHRPSDE